MIIKRGLLTGLSRYIKRRSNMYDLVSSLSEYDDTSIVHSVLTAYDNRLSRKICMHDLSLLPVMMRLQTGNMDLSTVSLAKHIMYKLIILNVADAVTDLTASDFAESYYARFKLQIVHYYGVRINQGMFTGTVLMNRDEAKATTGDNLSDCTNEHGLLIQKKLDAKVIASFICNNIVLNIRKVLCDRIMNISEIDVINYLLSMEQAHGIIRGMARGMVSIDKTSDVASYVIQSLLEYE